MHQGVGLQDSGQTCYGVLGLCLESSLQEVQRCEARFVLHRYERKASVTDMFLELKWDTLEQRRLKARTVMMLRILHNLVINDSCQTNSPTLL